ncbi:MAG: TonB-dependent receptor [Sphingomonadales bacterium]|nr:MAG: TonB-dependent receptor [Sphingomonadales bacterium]TNF02167.1 MAG: TonB-dependent receptor [Sphingomonadales bacterium]
MTAFKIRLLVGLASSALTVSTANAQGLTDAGPGSEPENMVSDEQIVVTGSHIPRPEIESAMPVSITKMEEAIALGSISAYDALARDPALGIGLNLGKIQSTNGSGAGISGGISAVNLRNLGTNRTLTLIDGQRRVSSTGTSSEVDINMIPVGMIDRIEVVTGGAAAIYGADALAGAVNIVTRSKVDGLNITATKGISQRGDAAQFMTSISTGGRFADGRGSFAIGGTYSETDPLAVADRQSMEEGGVIYWANPANTGPNDGIPDTILYKNFKALYVGFDPSYYLGGKNYVIQNGVPREAVCETPLLTGGLLICDGVSSDGRVPAYNEQIRGGVTSLALMGNLDYELTDTIKYGAYFSYGRNKYSGNVYQWHEDSRSVYFHGAGGAVAYLDNPYLPDAVRQQMLDAGVTRINIDRTYGNLPYRTEKNDRESFTIGQNVGGKLTEGLHWKAFFQYGRVNLNADTYNTPYESHWLAARDVIADPETGQAVCRDEAARAAGCLPLNIFGQNAPSQEALDYLMGDVHSRQVSTQRIYGANIGGNLLRLPYGDLAIALGVEHRKESLKTTPDALARSGETSYTFGPVTIDKWDVSSSVSELYGEVRVPILAHLPYAERLEIGGAYRYSDYDTVGDTHTWKADASWSPFTGITFRGVRSRAVRVPNFSELYSSQNTSQLAGYIDPCQDSVYYLSETRAANCRALGITTPLAYSGTGPVYTSGGNPDLKPETSDSLTLGVVLQPDFLPGFDLTVDYWNIDIKDIITSFSATTMLDLCVDLPTIDNPFCKNIVRDTETHAPTSILGSLINAAHREARGIDIGANYRRRLGGGQINLAFKGTYLIKDVTKTTPGLATGDVVNDGGWQGYQRFRASLTTAYDIGKFGVVLNTRFMSASKYSVNTTSSEAYPDDKVPAKLYNDLGVEFRITPDKKIGFGVQNLMDVGPVRLAQPISINYTTFDWVGRYFYVTTSLKF